MGCMGGPGEQLELFAGSRGGPMRRVLHDGILLVVLCPVTGASTQAGSKLVTDNGGQSGPHSWNGPVLVVISMLPSGLVVTRDRRVCLIRGPIFVPPSMVPRHRQTVRTRVTPIRGQVTLTQKGALESPWG